MANAFKDNSFAIFGCPDLLCDNGKQLIGQRMQSLIIEGGGEMVQTAPYSPEQNAEERVHRTLMQRIRALQ